MSQTHPDELFRNLAVKAPIPVLLTDLATGNVIFTNDACDMGLPADTHQDLVDALFADGMSTRDEATETSGRGVGMSALRHAVEALGGHLELESHRGRGTELCAVLPL